MLDSKSLWVGLLLAGLTTAPAVAQDTGGEPLPEPDMAWDDEPASASPALDEEQAELELEDPLAEPKDGKWYLGLFYRHTFTPNFILGLFLDEHTKANNPGTGFEATYSRDNLDISITAFWQRYNAYGPFRGSGDPLIDTEMIDSNLSMGAVGVNFLWTTAFNDKIALQYGLDLAIGMIFGSMTRTEAYQTTDSSIDGQKGGWAPCQEVGNPDPTFCNGPSVRDGEQGGHYGIKARRWTDGGSVPNVWFRAALPHLALRFTPTEALRIRIDGGFDLFSGFFLGAAVAVGL
jgi:hypothetical protein